jgi:predicted RNase H-like HicB family nuclease
MSQDYHINIFYSPDDEGYIAAIPDFTMCSGFGTTPQEASEQVLIARDAIMLTMQERGLPVPSPRYRPAIYQSGRSPR